MCFRTIRLVTIDDFKAAEKLIADGWVIRETSLFEIMLSKGKSGKY